MYKAFRMLSRTLEGLFLTNQADLHFALNPKPRGHEKSRSLPPFCPISSVNPLLTLSAPSQLGEFPMNFTQLPLLIWFCCWQKTVFAGKSIKWIVIVNVPCNFYFVFQQSTTIHFWPRWKKALCCSALNKKVLALFYLEVVAIVFIVNPLCTRYSEDWHCNSIQSDM